MTEDRVFFDTNTGDPETGYLLIFDDSRADLSRMHDRLQNGAEVVLYMPGEVEVQAKLRFDPHLDCWLGIPIRPVQFTRE